MIWQQGDRYYWLEQGVVSSVSLDTILKSADGGHLNGWMVHDEVSAFGGDLNAALLRGIDWGLPLTTEASIDSHWTAGRHG